MREETLRAAEIELTSADLREIESTLSKITEQGVGGSVVDRNRHDARVVSPGEAFAIPADSFVSMVAFATDQLQDVDVNEILFRPTTGIMKE